MIKFIKNFTLFVVFLAIIGAISVVATVKEKYRNSPLKRDLDSLNIPSLPDIDLPSIPDTTSELDSIKWYPVDNDTRSFVSKNDKCTFMYFKRDNSKQIQQFERSLFNDKDVVDALNNKFVSVKFTEEQQFTKYQITEFPTIIINTKYTSPKPSLKIEGKMGPQKLLIYLNDKRFSDCY